MIYEIVNEYSFRNAFLSSEIYKDKYSYDGLRALYEYLKSYSEDTGDNIELDIVSIACDFTEYDSAYEAMEQYQPEDMPTLENSEGVDLIEIQEATEAKCLEWLHDRTTVIEVGNSHIIIANF